jgi:2-polyprenyl-3-methyl-5-hydroxy-6-metoxy-1,4-benzoquinol methylase
MPPESAEQEAILWTLEEQAPRYNEWLLERIRPFLGTDVLEIGAGIGTFTLMLAQAPNVRRVVALEPDKHLAGTLVERTKGVGNVEVLQNPVEELTPELVGGAVGSVVCFNVLEHIQDDRTALVRTAQCLRPGGSLFLLSPAHALLFGEVDRAVHHQRRYGKAALARLLRDTGFAVETIRYVNPVGALGWLVSSRLLKVRDIPSSSLRIYEHLVPALKVLDRVPMPFGLSVWVRAVRDDDKPA